MSMKDKILETSFDLILEKGIHNVSMKEIIQKSGVSNGTLYHYFPTKDKIVEEIYSNITKEIVTKLSQSIKADMNFREFLWSTWETTISFHIEHQKKYRFMKSFKDTALVESCKILGESIGYEFNRFDEALSSELIDVPSMDYFDIMFGVTIYGVVDYLLLVKAYDDKKLMRNLFDKFWRSIVKL